MGSRVNRPLEADRELPGTGRVERGRPLGGHLVLRRDAPPFGGELARDEMTRAELRFANGRAGPPAPKGAIPGLRNPETRRKTPRFEGGARRAYHRRGLRLLRFALAW